MSAEVDLHELWQRRYTENAEDSLSWFEAEPRTSLELVERFRAGPGSSIIDIGGGASRLVDALIRSGWHDVTVLDLSEAALGIAQKRLGPAASGATWIAADVTQWCPGRTFDLWHDRAAFHFLTEAADRDAYVARMKDALKPGAYAIIATFAPDAPRQCSGLPIVRYDSQSLVETIGAGFSLVASQRHEHLTPAGTLRPFMFYVLRRV